MKIRLIVAMDREGLIGLDGGLPWEGHKPLRKEDMAWFRRATMHHTVIMGRKTFESIGRPLPSRNNVIVSSKPALAITDCTETLVADSLDKAFGLCTTDLVYVIGGGEIYKEMLTKHFSKIEECYVTVARCSIKVREGSRPTYFPLKPGELGLLGDVVSCNRTKYADYMVYKR